MATVLVIEDDDLLRAMIATILRFESHTVIEARDGKEGLDRHALGSGAFDLVICDLILPVTDGTEVIRRFQTRVPNVAVLAISGSAHVLRALTQIEGLAGQAVLPKPFTPTELVDAVNKLIEQTEGAGLNGDTCNSLREYIAGNAGEN